MRIDIENTIFIVTPDENDNKQLINLIIENVASYIDPSYLFKRRELIKKYKNNPFLRKKWEKWNGNVCLFEKHANYYIVNGGLLFSFLRALVLFNIDYEIKMLKTMPHIAKSIKFEGRIKLFDYQKKIVEQIIENDGVGLISAPTGSGKTIIGTELTAIYNTQTIIIADRKNIIEQWVRTFTRKRKSNLFFKRIKSVYVGYVEEEPRILVCTSLFLSRYYSKSKTIHNDVSYIVHNCDLLIYDEVHRAGSKSGIVILDHCQARYRIGLSGTLLKRTDGRDLEYVSRIGQPIACINSDELLEKEKTVPIDVYFKPVRRIGSRKMNYKEMYENAIIKNRHRNDKILDAILDFVNKNMKFIVFVDKIIHAQELSMISGIDYTDAKDKDQSKKFSDLENGEIFGIICTYELAGLGYDLPSLDGLIFAGAGKSAVRFIQAKGRLTRIFKKKKRGIIIDFADTSRYFGDHAMERYKIYREERDVNVHAKGTWLHER